VKEESKLNPELKQEELDQWQAEVSSLGERLMQAQKAIIKKRRESRKADHDGTS
jgi:hypothetical protein